MAARVEKFENATLYLGDCVELLPKINPKSFDVILTDPPYGIGESKGKNKSRGNLKAKAKDYGDLDWDSAPPLAETFDLLLGISTRQIIFGGNYFELPASSCWLVWDKCNGQTDFADCELAWTNLKKAVRKIEWPWNGFIRKGNEERFHPTQKPLGVMKWCLDQLPENIETILDPFMGSGTTGVAAVEYGKTFIGIEREPQYFDVACRRIEQASKQKCLF